MPTNRRKLTRNPTRQIPPEAYAAFRDGDSVALTAALRLPPWYPSPMDVDDDEPPEWAAGSPYGDAWPEVRAIRIALEAGA